MANGNVKKVLMDEMDSLKSEWARVRAQQRQLSKQLRLMARRRRRLLRAGGLLSQAEMSL